MKKNVTICFRTNTEISNAVKKIADGQRQSISFVIESALYNYLKEKKALQGLEKDRRQYARKQVSLPAFIMDPKSEMKVFQTGKVLDISLGGIRLSVPQGLNLEISADSETSEFHVIFTLPEATQPLNLKCRSRQCINKEPDTHVGAAFVDSDFQSYQALQQYLI
jgi:hypothetical protein